MLHVFMFVHNWVNSYNLPKNGWYLLEKFKSVNDALCVKKKCAKYHFKFSHTFWHCYNQNNEKNVDVAY